MHSVNANPWKFLNDRAKVAMIAAVSVVMVVWLICSLIAPAGGSVEARQEGGKDLEAYRRIVERVYRGESYYVAAGDELRAGGYATTSVFNWRLPTYAWLLAAFPRPEWGQVILGLFALVGLGLAYAHDRRDGSVARSGLLLLLMAGAFLWCIDGDAFFSQELWAGVLIAVSVGFFAVERRVLGVAAGLAALFMRELALPYVIVSMALTVRDRQWREFTAWLCGLVVFGVYMGWHAWQVSMHRGGIEHAEIEGWIQFGGPAFVAHTSQMNVWLFNLPAWIAMVFLLASLLGLAIWRGPVAERVGAAVVAYLLAFLLVGKSCNMYWGLLYVGLLPFGLVRFPEALNTIGAVNSQSPLHLLNKSTTV